MNQYEITMFRENHRLVEIEMGWDEAVDAMDRGLFVMRPSDDIPCYACKEHDGLILGADDEIPEFKLRDYTATDWEAWK